MKNIIQFKSYKFSLEIIKVYKILVYNKKEYVLSKQLLKCGTSIGANVEEAIGAQTKNDFIAKMFIAYKEARETRYWIRLLRDSDILRDDKAKELINDIEEICKIIGKILSSSRNRRKNR